MQHPNSVTNMMANGQRNNSNLKNGTNKIVVNNSTSSSSNEIDKVTSNNVSGSATNPSASTNSNAVLKEAVDAVVNSFTKHTQSYGRGEF